MIKSMCYDKYICNFLLNKLFAITSFILRITLILAQNETQITHKNDTELWLRIVIDYKICENDTYTKTVKFRLIEKCLPLILTPYIETNRFEEARHRSAVDLPNAPKITSYSGYLTVNKQYNSNMFFWFFPSINNTKPVILVLQGGPGCSVIPLVFGGSGPFTVNGELRLKLFQYSWTNQFSMLYIENPIGTGFSFTDNENGYSSDIEQIADNLYNALQQFFSLFSEFRKSEFYIAGISYAGKFIPAIGYKLHQMADKSNINFRGIAIGNGWIDPINQLDLASFLYQIGLVDDRQAKYFYEIQNKITQQIEKQNYTEAFIIADELFGDNSYYNNITGGVSWYNYLYCNSQFREYVSHFERYLSKKKTHHALHVGCMKFYDYNCTVRDFLAEDVFKSVTPWFVTLMNNYKVLIFSGLLDVIVATPLTVNFLNKLKWKYSQEFAEAERLVWKVEDSDEEVAGYVKQVANFTFVTIRNVGHSTVFEYPRVTYDMITNFIYSKKFNAVSFNKSINNL